MTEGDKEIIALLTKIQATGGSGSGGPVNTGNAAPGDVASGKTFSSATMTNVPGTSTNNATVPGSSPFLPAQAFVDNIGIFASTWVNSTSGRTYIFSGISQISLSSNPSSPDFTKGDAIILQSMFAVDDTGNVTYDFTSCPLDVASVNGLFAALVAGFFTPASAAEWKLELGGLCAAPTGQGLTDKATLIVAGWTITTN